MATGDFRRRVLGFAVKVPLIPFHTWLPAAYAEAPTGTTMLLTGRDVEDGRLRIPAHPAADFPEADAGDAHAAALAGGGHHRFFRVRGVCAARFETDVCLFLDQPSWILSAGRFCRRQIHRQ